MQYRWCTGKRGSGSAPDQPRGDSSSRGLVVLMDWHWVDGEVVAIATFTLILYVCWLRFRVQVHRNRLDRRQYFEPPTGRPWIRPRARY